MVGTQDKYKNQLNGCVWSAHKSSTFLMIYDTWVTASIMASHGDIIDGQ